MLIQLKGQLVDAHADGIWALACSGYGDDSGSGFLVTGSLDEQANVWDLEWSSSSSSNGQQHEVNNKNQNNNNNNNQKNDENGVLEKRSSVHPGSLGITAIAAYSEYFCTNSMDEYVKLFDYNGQLLKIVEVEPLQSWTVALNPVDGSMACGGSRGIINIYQHVLSSNSTNSQQSQQQQLKGSQNSNSGISQTSSHITSDSKPAAADPTQAKLLTPVRMEPSHCIDSKSDKMLLSLCYSSSGALLAAGMEDGQVVVCDMSSCAVIYSYTGHTGPVRALAFSADSQYLCTGSDDKHVHIYEMKKGECVCTLPQMSAWILSLTFIKLAECKNSVVVAGLSDSRVLVWDWVKRECMFAFKDHADQCWGVESVDDKLVTVSDDKSICVYKISL